VNHPVSYQIRIRGRLGPTMRRAFPALHAETRGEDTLLVEVRRCESPGRVTPPHPGTRNAEFS
jgi:hypothetical protein